jgi:hypothetical protein
MPIVQPEHFMNKPIVFTAGIFVGAVLFVSGRTLIVNDMPPVERVSADPAVLKAAQDAAAREKAFRDELDQREAYVIKAENKLGLGTPASATAAAPKADDKSKMMNAIIGSVMKSQMDMKMAALKARLNLSPDQEKAIQDILDKQAQLAQSMAGKMMDGASEDDMDKTLKDQGIDKDALNLEKQLPSILSPDQLAEYQNMQADDKKSQAEAMTNMELSSIQGPLQLSDDQKDQVFNALQQLGPGGSDEAKKAALQPLLSPAQFDTYSKYLDSQAQMVKSFMPAKPDDNGDTSAPAAQ